MRAEDDSAPIVVETINAVAVNESGVCVFGPAYFDFVFHARWRDEEVVSTADAMAEEEVIPSVPLEEIATLNVGNPSTLQQGKMCQAVAEVCGTGECRDFSLEDATEVGAECDEIFAVCCDEEIGIDGIIRISEI